MNFKDNLKKIRKDNNLSQEELADKLNVSRQAVSKWESGLAYPEMDKVIQICKLFNLNMDDLLNKDIKEVNTINEEKTKANKQIESFLEFITKTVNLFSSMRFWDIIKCLLEQMLLLFMFYVIYLILATIGNYFIRDLFTSSFSWVIYRIIGIIFSLSYSVLIIVILLHIFKIRYLDYYTIVNKNDLSEKENIDFIKEEKVTISKRNEKIIIRDPEKSGSGVLSSLAKIVVIMFKIFVGFLLLGFTFTLICIVISMVLSFLFTKTGLFFIGVLIYLLGALALNVLVIISLYNFIFNQKSKWRNHLIVLICSLILLGVGIGLALIGFKDFNVVSIDNPNYYIKDVKTYEMNDNLKLSQNFYRSYYNYIITDSDDITVEIIRPKNMDCTSTYNAIGNAIIFVSNDNYNYMEEIRFYFDALSHKDIIDYKDIRINIYISEKNLEKITNR